MRTGTQLGNTDFSGIAADPGKRSWAMVGLGGALVLGGLVWFGWARVQSVDPDATSAVDISSKVFKALLSRQEAFVEAAAKTVIDDARIRTTLATPGVDGATIEDVLQDIKSTGIATMIAVLDPNGRVLAVVGADSLRGSELGSSAMVKKAISGDSASGVWSFPEGLLTVAVAPVRLGNQASHLMIIGRAVEASDLRTVDEITGVQSAFIVGGKAVSPSQGASPEALAAVVNAPPSLTARADLLDEGTAGASVVWLLTKGRHEGPAQAMVGLPTALIVLGGAALVGVALRRQ